jgi:hypothetical protein
MTTQAKPKTNFPGNVKLNLKQADAMIKKVIQENKEWLKEMADK